MLIKIENFYNCIAVVDAEENKVISIFSNKRKIDTIDVIVNHINSIGGKEIDRKVQKHSIYILFSIGEQYLLVQHYGVGYWCLLSVIPQSNDQIESAILNYGRLYCKEDIVLEKVEKVVDQKIIKIVSDYLLLRG
jgi:hypothetical protein